MSGPASSITMFYYLLELSLENQDSMPIEPTVLKPDVNNHHSGRDLLQYTDFELGR